MLRLVVLSGTHAGKVLPLTGGRLLVGRGAECGARIPSPEVSRKHCIFAEENGKLVVEDLGSRNGTLVNGEMISLRTTLEEGDRINICSLEILVAGEQPPPKELSEPKGPEHAETVPQPTPDIRAVRESRIHPGRLPSATPAEESSCAAADRALKKFFGRG